MGPIVCPETSVQNYHSTPRIIPEERRYLLHRSGSLKSRIENFGEETSLCSGCLKIRDKWEVNVEVDSHVRRSECSTVVPKVGFEVGKV